MRLGERSCTVRVAAVAVVAAISSTALAGLGSSQSGNQAAPGHPVQSGAPQSVSEAMESGVATGQAPAQFAAPGEVAEHIVLLEEPPAARYRGGIEGMAATSPVVTGARHFDANAPAVREYRGFLESRQIEILDQIAERVGERIEPESRWQLANNGFAAEMDGETARQIAEVPGVRHVKQRIPRMPLTFLGPEYIGATEVWDENGTNADENKGEGIVVGIVDSGVNSVHMSFAEQAPADNYEHDNPAGDGVFLGVCDPNDEDQDFEEDFNCNNKLIGAYDYTGAGAEDDNGHGTHVAGTAIGNEIELDNGILVSGVAPRANVISYRICDAAGCSGVEEAAEDMLDDAVQPDVINYSIGPVAGGGDPYLEISAQTFLSLNDAGTTVVAAGGNSGPGSETISNFAPWNLTVASNDHAGVMSQDVTVTGPDSVPGALENIPAAPDFSFDLEEDVEADLVSTADLGNPSACDDDGDLPADSLDGAIGVAHVLDCPFLEKAENMAEAGAEGMILFTPEALSTVPFVMGADEDFPIPSVWIDYADQDEFVRWVEAENGEGRIEADTVVRSFERGEHALAASSSRGPGMGDYPELPGPDVTAPGASIFAAWIGGEGSFASIGGTSMASPHVAGAAALLAQVEPDWSPSQIQSALMATADPDTVVMEDFSGTPTVFDQGSGLTRVDVAAEAGLILDESKDNFEDADPDGGDLQLHELNVPFLSRVGCAVECTWERTVEATVAGSWETSGSAIDSLDVEVEPDSFNLSEGETETITITAEVTDEIGEDEWAFGTVLLEETTGMGSDTRFPLQVQNASDELPPPVFSPEGGDFLDDELPLDVAMTSLEEDEDIEIRYEIVDAGETCDPDGGETVEQGEAVEIGDDATLCARAEKAGSSSEVSEAEYLFFPEPEFDLESAEAGSGETVEFSVSGGSESEALILEGGVNAISGAEGTHEFDGESGSFTVPSGGAFAGTYELTVVDERTEGSDSFTVSVALESDSGVEEIGRRESTDLNVRGAEAGYSFDFEVRQDGEESDIASLDPEQASASDSEGEGNAATTTVSLENAQGVESFEVQIDPEDDTYADLSHGLTGNDPGPDSGFCSLGSRDRPLDPVLPLLALMALGVLLVRRRV